MSLFTPKGIVPDTDIASAPATGKAHAERLLQLVFKDQWLRAHVAGVPPNAAKGVGWDGGRYVKTHDQLLDTNACYFCQSTFTGDRRGWDDWEALWCVVLDDVGPRVNPDDVLRTLGQPAWRIESSPGNWQWGYLLKEPERDRGLCELLFDELKKRKLCDPGACTPIGYRRLPMGVNHKYTVDRHGQMRVVFKASRA